MYLDCGRKLEFLERIHTDARRTLHLSHCRPRIRTWGLLAVATGLTTVPQFIGVVLYKILKLSVWQFSHQSVVPEPQRREQVPFSVETHKIANRVDNEKVEIIDFVFMQASVASASLWTYSWGANLSSGSLFHPNKALVVSVLIYICPLLTDLPLHHRFCSDGSRNAAGGVYLWCSDTRSSRWAAMHEFGSL